MNKSEEVKEIYEGYFDPEEVARCFSLHKDRRRLL